MRWLPIIFLFVAGCQIAPYDAGTDSALTGIQTTFDAHLSDIASGKHDLSVYTDLGNKFHALQIRLNARDTGTDPSIGIESKAAAEVQAIVDEAKQLESSATTQPDATQPATLIVVQNLFDTAIGSVLSMELRRK